LKKKAINNMIQLEYIKVAGINDTLGGRIMSDLNVLPNNF